MTFEGVYDLTWSFDVREYCFADKTPCLLASFDIGSLFRKLSGLELLHGSSLARSFAKKELKNYRYNYASQAAERLVREIACDLQKRSLLSWHCNARFARGV